MSKLRIEHGASKINWVMLKTNIEESISTDIDRMCQWSNNDRKYVVNELLRFGLAQSEDFQKYKADLDKQSPKTTGEAKSIPVVSTTASDPAVKSGASPTTAVNRQ